MADNFTSSVGKSGKATAFANRADTTFSSARNAASHDIAEAVDTTIDTVRNYAKKADDLTVLIRQEPIKYTLFALGLGFLLGRIV